MLAEVQTAEYDDGRDGNDPSGTPCRRCIVSGESRETAALVRFAVGPDDQIVPDIAESLPGRGIWISADRASIAAAVANRLFARAAAGGNPVAGSVPRFDRAGAPRRWRRRRLR